MRYPVEFMVTRLCSLAIKTASIIVIISNQIIIIVAIYLISLLTFLHAYIIFPRPPPAITMFLFILAVIKLL